VTATARADRRRSRGLLRYDRLLGRVVRWPLRLVPAGAVVRVLRGPARGARWIAGAGPHGMWLGHYERQIAASLALRLSKGAVFYDVGANAGYYSVMGCRLVGPEGRVLAFEPIPANVSLLRRHLELNRCQNCEVIEAAVAGVSGTATFADHDDRFTGRLAVEGSRRVRAVTIDELVGEEGLPPPSVIKMDIEGGESEALAGARRTLIDSRPAIILATHGRGQLERCRSLLEGFAYEIRMLAGDERAGLCELVATPRRRASADTPPELVPR
jgi:FkbM family methyltransferase